MIYNFKQLKTSKWLKLIKLLKKQREYYFYLVYSDFGHLSLYWYKIPETVLSMN